MTKNIDKTSHKEASRKALIFSVMLSFWIVGILLGVIAAIATNVLLMWLPSPIPFLAGIIAFGMAADTYIDYKTPKDGFTDEMLHEYRVAERYRRRHHPHCNCTSETTLDRMMNDPLNPASPMYIRRFDE